MKKRKRPYVHQATEEDVIRIRKETKEKFDAIFSNPNWREDLGRKYYGDTEWYKIYHGEKHPLGGEIKKELGTKQIRVNTNFVKLPITQMELDGTHIKDFKNVKEVLKEYGWLPKHQTHILMTCKGKAKTAYGYKWRFNIDNDEEE